MIGCEVVLAVAAATAGVAALQSSTPVEGLGILYLLAVLLIAIRRGQWPALITAVLSVLTFNYLYIPPATSSRSPTPPTWSNSSCC